jgi:hypothetical protein
MLQSSNIKKKNYKKAKTKQQNKRITIKIKQKTKNNKTAQKITKSK